MLFLLFLLQYTIECNRVDSLPNISIVLGGHNFVLTPKEYIIVVSIVCVICMYVLSVCAWLCVCVRMYVYVCAHMCMCARVCVYVCVCTHAHVCLCICVSVYILLYPCLCVCVCVKVPVLYAIHLFTVHLVLST